LIESIQDYKCLFLSAERRDSKVGSLFDVARPQQTHGKDHEDREFRKFVMTLLQPVIDEVNKVFN
jgi:hypothetical protein